MVTSTTWPTVNEGLWLATITASSLGLQKAAAAAGEPCSRCSAIPLYQMRALLYSMTIKPYTKRHKI